MIQKIPWLTLAMVAGVGLSAGIALSYLQNRPADPRSVDGLLWPDPPLLDPIALIDQHGAPFTLEQLRGRWSLLFFGFTHCPDVCPLTLDILSRAHAELATHPAYSGRGQVIFVSIDPERDSPALLAEYVGHFDPAFIGVTAPLDLLPALTRKLGVFFQKTALNGSDYSVDHTAAIFFIDPALRFVSVMMPPLDVATVVKRFDAISTFIDTTL